MLIQILVDNPNSWIIPYAKELRNQLLAQENDCRLIYKHKEVVKGDILCLLSCERIFKSLNLNQCNLVVHESDLPKGKGWSPLTWQILEGENMIPITLFEASASLDAGKIYDKKYIELTGTELLPEIKHQQGIVTQQLILEFVSNYPAVKGKEQAGIESFYQKRKSEDSKLDISKSIEEQFNLLRVCDNERYPAFFELDGEEYILKIYRKKD